MKKYLIYILLLLFTAPYISSCSDEWTDSDKLSLLTKAEEEEPVSYTHLTLPTKRIV